MLLYAVEFGNLALIKATAKNTLRSIPSIVIYALALFGFKIPSSRISEVGTVVYALQGSQLPNSFFLALAIKGIDIDTNSQRII